MIGLTIYLGAVFVVGILVNNIKNAQIKKIYLKAIFLIAFFYSGLRGPSVGRDTFSTLQIFDRIALNGLAELPRNTELEKGYMILCLILSKFINHPQIITIVNSAIVSYSFYWIIKNYSHNYMISSVIFFSSIFTITMNISRQYLALAFAMFAIKTALEKEKLKTGVFLFLAGMMHYSAFVFLPLWLLSFPWFKFTGKKMALVGILSLAAIPTYMAIVSFVTNIFPQYSRFLRSDRYSSSSQVSYAFVALLLFILLLNLPGIIPVSLKGTKLIFQKNHKEKRVREESEYHKSTVANYLFTLMFIEYIVVYIISTKLWIAGRLIYYFQISVIILLPNLLERVESKNIQLSRILKLFFICYYLHYGYRYYINDPHAILPYSFFWD